MVSLIKELEERYTLNTTPDVSTTVAQSLIQLSSGIYTEEERFIFELLQNAVDAHDSKANSLNIKIVLKDDYLIFMHNGEPFSERDIKGLCDIGNGNKTKDVKKIGYKGIGFKSVFMRSTCVTVETGKYCFKFDKSHWDNYWEKNWKTEYGNKEPEKKYLMPWQIIPIETTPAIHVDKVGYNVVTYIQLHKNKNIAEKIEKLLASSQFLLFLKASNIRITFEQDNVTISTIEKSTQNDKVTLSSNGQIENQWLIYSNDEVPVPDNVREEINLDTNTPEKLKDVKTFDLSFAIALSSDGKLKRVDKKDAVIYTYLPTSFKFGTEGFPFLVNANFITDAGRQQLHKDSEWNKLIFSKIPSEFLKWMANISANYYNYYDILPEMNYGDNNPLEKIFHDEMISAIDSIAFIPQQDNLTNKVYVKEALLDSIGISDIISKEVFLTHINRNNKCTYSIENLIAPVRKSYKVLEDYGVFVFKSKNIKNLFDDNKAFYGITPEYNVKLINYIYDLYTRTKINQEEFFTTLQNSSFLLDKNCSLRKPIELFFSSQNQDFNNYHKETPFLNEAICKPLEGIVIEWLRTLGVSDLSDESYIEKVICQYNYINEENAIETIRYLYDVNRRKDIVYLLQKYQWRLSFLTQKGNLKSITNLFASAKYLPELNLEPICNDDIFISDEYPRVNDDIISWRLFFEKLGLKYSLGGLQYISLKNSQGIPHLEKVEAKMQTMYYYPDTKQYRYTHANSFYIRYAPFVLTSDCSPSFEKLIWSELFKSEIPEQSNAYGDHVDGQHGYFSHPLYFEKDLGHSEFLVWAIKEYQKFYATNGSYSLAKTLLVNSEGIKSIGGIYLPIIDVDCEIHEEWLKLLNLRTQLTLDDYLELLTSISNDVENAIQNKERISMVYQRLLELDCLTSTSKQEKLKSWAETNKILSVDNTFKSPSELSYITLDGFGSDNRVYIGNPANRNKVIELLELMGVKIITENNIHPDFNNTEKDSTELKNILVHWLSPLALIAAGENPTEEEYTKAKEQIKKKLLESHFYHCETIKLTYGNSDDVIDRHTFAQENDFYYIGNLRPANVEPLLNPLCKYLGISKKERELFIILIEDFDGIRQNLEDKGYTVELLEEPKEKPSGTIVTSIGGGRSISQQERDRITGFKGEILVYEKLKSFGYTPISQTISEIEFEGATTISMFGKTYYCKDNFNRYDMCFETKNGTKVFVEVKSTTWNKEAQENMPISYNELSMIEDYQHNERERYVIVRVFGINQNKQDIYLFEGQIIDTNPFENL